MLPTLPSSTSGLPAAGLFGAAGDLIVALALEDRAAAAGFLGAVVAILLNSPLVLVVTSAGLVQSARVVGARVVVCRRASYAVRHRELNLNLVVRVTAYLNTPQVAVTCNLGVGPNEGLEEETGWYVVGGT